MKHNQEQSKDGKNSPSKEPSKPEKKWCAWCGVWGDHTSGGCDDLHEVLLRRNTETNLRARWEETGTERKPEYL